MKYIYLSHSENLCSLAPPPYFSVLGERTGSTKTSAHSRHAITACSEYTDATQLIPCLCYFSFQPVLHDWCNKGGGMCHPVCGMMHIKEPLLLIGKSSPCGGSRFLLSLSEWSFTICLMPYNRKCVECVVK